jgi:hypothetical protein
MRVVRRSVKPAQEEPASWTVRSCFTWQEVSAAARASGIGQKL